MKKISLKLYLLIWLILMAVLFLYLKDRCVFTVWNSFDVDAICIAYNWK